MVDPLSVAGLTIAIFDDLIKAGFWTAEVIRDARAFDEDTQRLTSLLQHDVQRTRLLKTLLFSEVPVYGGATLFDKLDEDMQQQTVRLLEESKDVLQPGLDLLHRRYGVVSPMSNPSPDPVLANSMSVSSTATTLAAENWRSRSNPSMQTLLRWSLRDKKRVEDIILKFDELSVRVERTVRLSSFAISHGHDLAHLRHLENDASSKQLGFNVDATLLLTQRDTESTSGSLELPNGSWNDTLMHGVKILSNSSPFCLYEEGGQSYLLENHEYIRPAWLVALPDRAEPCGLDTGTMKRVEALAKLLHQPKEQVFRVPRCLGWKYVSAKQAVTFAFQIPTGSCAISLLSLLSNTHGRNVASPSLEEKFRLAAGLAACMAQFHMVEWLHESFRSENVLFFASQAADNLDLDLDFASPWVLGFEFSRPIEGTTRANVDFLPDRDIYRHPQRQGQPEVSFTRIHDIYALGVVLLEIGLWEPAITLQKNGFASVSSTDAGLIRSQLLKHADRRLGKRVGKKYKDIVVKCLQGDFGVVDDTRGDLKLQQAFRAQVIDVLVQAANAV